MPTGQGRATVNHRTATALLGVVIAAAGLTACGSDKGDKDAVKPPPSVASSAPAAPAAPAAPSAPVASGKALAEGEAKSGIPPKPDAVTQAVYIRALAAISPALVNGREDRAVSRGRDTCGTIHSFPADHGKQVSLTQRRFSGATQVTEAQAERILTVVQEHLCRVR